MVVAPHFHPPCWVQPRPHIQRFSDLRPCNILISILILLYLDLMMSDTSRTIFTEHFKTVLNGISYTLILARAGAGTLGII